MFKVKGNKTSLARKESNLSARSNFTFGRKVLLASIQGSGLLTGSSLFSFATHPLPNESQVIPNTKNTFTKEMLAKGGLSSGPTFAIASL